MTQTFNEDVVINGDLDLNGDLDVQDYVTSDLSLFDDDGDSPALCFVTESNNDVASISATDHATVKSSKLVVKLPGEYGTSALELLNCDSYRQLYLTDDGDLVFQRAYSNPGSIYMGGYDVEPGDMFQRSVTVNVSNHTQDRLWEQAPMVSADYPAFEWVNNDWHQMLRLNSSDDPTITLGSGWASVVTLAFETAGGDFEIGVASKPSNAATVTLTLPGTGGSDLIVADNTYGDILEIDRYGLTMKQDITFTGVSRLEMGSCNIYMDYGGYITLQGEEDATSAILRFTTPSEGDWIDVFMDDEPFAGYSDLIVKLADDNGASKLIIAPHSTDEGVAYMASDGDMFCARLAINTAVQDERLKVNGNIKILDGFYLGLGASAPRFSFDDVTGIAMLGGNFGVGTVLPAAALHAVSSSQSPAMFEWYNTTDTTTPRRCLLLKQTTTQSAGANFGPYIEFSMQDVSASENGLVRLYALRQSADDEGAFVVAVASGGGPTEKLRVTTEGYLGVGTNSPEYGLHVYGSSMEKSSLLLNRVENQAYGPRLTLRQSRGVDVNGQDGDYLGHIQFRGNNERFGPEEICYTEIVGRIGDATDGTEDGVIQFRTMKNGTLGTKFSVGANYVSFTNVTEALAVIDAGSAGATEQDWVQVEVGGNTGYIWIHSGK